MQTPPSDPEICDNVPGGEALTAYDEQHFVTYLRLLDAESAGGDWRDAARTILCVDPDREPERARCVWERHLARARWMTGTGYRHLLRRGASG